MATDPAAVQRSVTFDVFAPDDDTRDAVRRSVARYRAAARQLYAALALGQTAGAELAEGDDDRVRLVPGNDRAKVVLAAAVDSARVERLPAGGRGDGQGWEVRAGKALAYELRDWFLTTLYPGAYSFVWDSARRDIQDVWAARDPEFPTASRGYLALQGARGLAWFRRRGIGFPPATARPKLAGRTLTLTWDRAIGAVEFALPNQLDGGRYHVWRALRDGDEGWKLGTVYLTERDGRLLAVLTHARPAARTDVDPARACRVGFGPGPDSFLLIRGPDGAATADGIDAHAAVAAMAGLLARREALERRRAACGNPRRPWGHRKGWLANQDVLGRVTLARDRQQADYNHAWTRRIVTRAAAWRCGVIRLGPLPETLFGHPWGWHQFREFLGYKAAERGIEVVQAAADE